MTAFTYLVTRVNLPLDDSFQPIRSPDTADPNHNLNVANPGIVAAINREPIIYGQPSTDPSIYWDQTAAKLEGYSIAATYYSDNRYTLTLTKPDPANPGHDIAYSALCSFQGTTTVGHTTDPDHSIPKGMLLVMGYYPGMSESELNVFLALSGFDAVPDESDPDYADFDLIRDAGIFFFLTDDDAEATSVINSTVDSPFTALFSYDYFNPASTPPCFLRGTRLLTRSGYRPVESLSEGEEILTLDCGWQPVRWIGHGTMRRAWTGHFLSHHYPIRILAGAFGSGLPEQDLWVSPKHAVFFRNHLIPAETLVNGVTVIRDREVEAIEYFHVLLDQHAVIFSEGLPTESYIPFQDMDIFENGDSCPKVLRQVFLASMGCYTECYPRQERGSAVQMARAYLAENFGAPLNQCAA